jgi:Tfp pilus assembly protein PilO
MSRRTRRIIAGVVLVVVLALCWFLLLNPVRGDIAAKNAEIDAERTKLSAAQVKLAQAETTRLEGRKNQARLLELAKMVPDSEEIPSLLLQIQDLADQSGIDFISITPGDAVQAKPFLILPLQLEFSGTYFDLSDFVYRTEQMVAGPGRLLAIKTIKLQLQGQGTAAAEATGSSVSPVLGVTMTLYAFEIAPAGTTATTGTGGAQPGTSSGAPPNGTVPTTNPSGS